MSALKRILIVEDDPDGQTVVGHVLQYMGYDIDVAADAEQAMSYLNSNAEQYQAAILDLALPGRSGWDLLDQIRNTEAIHTIPCIAVTGFHSSKTREDAFRAGFVAYFAKPLEATSFARELESLLS